MDLRVFLNVVSLWKSEFEEYLELDGFVAKVEELYEEDMGKSDVITVDAVTDVPISIVGGGSNYGRFCKDGISDCFAKDSSWFLREW